LAHDAVGKHWVFSTGTGYDPKRELIEEDYIDERVVVGMVRTAAAACPRWRSSYVPRSAASTSRF
jgi:hypothetical protein